MAAKEKGDWRSDPRWTLVSFELTYWTSAPEQIPPQAELCDGGAWASVFDHGRPVATWYRVLPMKLKGEKR